MYMPLAAAPTWLSFALIMLRHQRLQLHLVDCRLALSAHRAHHHVSAHGLGDSARSGSLPSPSACMMVSIWAMLWFSSRLYRVGILMYGKRATLPELLRWLRYS